MKKYKVIFISNDMTGQSQFLKLYESCLISKILQAHPENSFTIILNEISESMYNSTFGIKNH